ncbi:TPA: Cro/CI family transcriptional regulator [Aeromonas hydrophila]
MQKNTVLEYFGTVTETAKALGISHVAVSKWNETIPKGRAYQIEVLTGGKLKADPAAPSAHPAQ